MKKNGSIEKRVLMIGCGSDGTWRKHERLSFFVFSCWCLCWAVGDTKLVLCFYIIIIIIKSVQIIKKKKDGCRKSYYIY